MSTTSLACKYDVENIYLLAEFGNDRVRKIIADNPDLSPYETSELVMKAFEAWKAARSSYISDDDSNAMDSEDEDEAGGEIGKLGDESKPGTVKRPQAPMEGELECKKPRIDEDSACQGEEHESGDTKDSSQ